LCILSKKNKQRGSTRDISPLQARFSIFSCF
jgi:hypothetical protein